MIRNNTFEEKIILVSQYQEPELILKKTYKNILYRI